MPGRGFLRGWMEKRSPGSGRAGVAAGDGLQTHDAPASCGRVICVPVDLARSQVFSDDRARWCDAFGDEAAPAATATTVPASTAITTITAAATASRPAVPPLAARGSVGLDLGRGRHRRRLGTELRLNGHRLFERDLLRLGQHLRIGRWLLNSRRSILGGHLSVNVWFRTAGGSGVGGRGDTGGPLGLALGQRQRLGRDRADVPLAWEVTDRLSWKPFLSAAATLDRARDQDECDRYGNDGVDLAYAHIPPIRVRTTGSSAGGSARGRVGHRC